MLLKTQGDGVNWDYKIYLINIILCFCCLGSRVHLLIIYMGVCGSFLFYLIFSFHLYLALVILDGYIETENTFSKDLFYKLLVIFNIA